MKMIHVIALLLVVLGGVHFALSGLGINLLAILFGGGHLAVLYIAMGVSTLYVAMPALKAKLAAL